IYTRVSTESQVLSGTSLTTQKEKGIQFAIEQNLKYQVYEDAGLSGSLSVAQRPALNQLMLDVFEGKIKTVWLIDLDRLSREKIEGSIILNDLLEYGVQLVVNNQVQDLHDENNNLLVGIRLLFADYERSKIKTRMQRGIVKAGQNGVALGSYMPLGYYKTEDRMIEIKEDEADVVRYMFDLYLQGLSTAQISKRLNDEGIPTKRGFLKNEGKQFQDKIRKGGGTIDKDGNYKFVQKTIIKTDFEYKSQSVYQSITNPIYKGERRYGDKIFPVPPIISPDVFDEVQKMLSTKMKTGRSNTHFSLLKGLVRCNECQNNYFSHNRGATEKNISSYMCSSKAVKFCGNEAIAQTRLDEMVIAAIKRLPDEISQYFAKFKDGSMQTEIDTRIQKHQLDIEEAETQTKKALALLLKDVITEADYIQIKDANSMIIEVAKGVIENHQKTINVVKLKKDISKYVKELIADIDTEDPQKQQQIIRAVLREVRVHKRELNENKDGEKRFSIRFKIDGLSEYKIETSVNVTTFKSSPREKKRDFEFIADKVVNEDLDTKVEITAIF
ncbi:MAG: recombinase family protein, partial [Sphingobacteriales bacterium]